MPLLSTRPYFPALMLLGVATLAAACGRPTTDAAAPRNIFGPDNRQLIESREFPYSTIGRLESGCTGTLVGRRLLVTAAHCVVQEGTGLIRPDLRYFYPNVISGQIREKAWVEHVWYGGDSPESDRTTDWAILQLSQPVGDTYKWMEVATPDIASLLPYTTNLAGYSLDMKEGKSASVHRGCYVMKVDGVRLFHDCDAWSGVSGGPLLNIINGIPYVVGLTVSEYRRGAPGTVTRPGWTEEFTNIGIHASTFASTVAALRQSADVGLAAPVLTGVMAKPNSNRPDSIAVDPRLPNPAAEITKVTVAHLVDRSIVAMRAKQLYGSIDGARTALNSMLTVARTHRDLPLYNAIIAAGNAAVVARRAVAAAYAGDSSACAKLAPALDKWLAALRKIRLIAKGKASTNEGRALAAQLAYFEQATSQVKSNLLRPSPSSHLP